MNVSSESILWVLQEQTLSEMSNAIRAMAHHAARGDRCKFEESCDRALGSCRKIIRSVEQLQECSTPSVQTGDRASC